MKIKTMGLALAMGMALTLGSGCMDETPSILLNGSFVLQGTISEEGPEDEPFEILNCGDYPGDVASGTTWAKGQINLTNLKRCGQACGVDGVIGPGGGPNTFTFIAGMMNKLPDSRTVGGRAGTSGAYLDQNNVWVREALVSFPPELNTFFHDGQERVLPELGIPPRLMSAYLSSGGGTVGTGIPIIASSTEVANIEGFLREDLGIRNEPVTFIAEIQVQGKSDAGTTIESNRFHFPIDICVNCEMMTTPICTVSN